MKPLLLAVVLIAAVPGAASPAFAQDAAMARALAFLETTIFNATSTAEMERIEKAYVAAHGPAPIATLLQVADHVEHVARIAGRDHVGIGSDFYGSTDEPTGLAWPRAAGRRRRASTHSTGSPEPGCQEASFDPDVHQTERRNV